MLGSKQLISGALLLMVWVAWGERKKVFMQQSLLDWILWQFMALVMSKKGKVMWIQWLYIEVLCFIANRTTASTLSATFKGRSQTARSVSSLRHSLGALSDREGKKSCSDIERKTQTGDVPSPPILVCVIVLKPRLNEKFPESSEPQFSMARYFINLFGLWRSDEKNSSCLRRKYAIKPGTKEKGKGNRSKGRARRATTIYLLTDKDGTHISRRPKRNTQKLWFSSWRMTEINRSGLPFVANSKPG